MDGHNTRRDDRRRNRPGSSTLTTVVTTAAIAYGAYRLASWAWNQYTKDGDEEEAEEERNPPLRTNFFSPPTRQGGTSSPQRWRIRRQRMTRCQEEVLKAMEGFLPSLRRIVEDRTSTRTETQAMKALRAERIDPSESVESSQQEEQQQQRRQQEQELWNTIQVNLITRMLATAYANTILFLVLTVQVNLLGGRLLEEQLSTRGQMSSLASIGPDSVASDRMGSYQASHRFVLLHTYDYFFERGLLSLITTVERAVWEVLANNEESWNVLDRNSLNLTRERMEDLIAAIRAVVEEGHAVQSSRRASRPKRSLLRFLMPPSAHVETPMEDELAASILDETWDLVESPVMMDAQQDCLNMTFDMMRDQHWGNLFASTTGESLWTTKPLASVIPQLKHTASSFYMQNEDDRSTERSSNAQPSVNSYCAMMQALPTVLELADVSFG